MIGTMDLTEQEQSMLLRVAARYLVFFESLPLSVFEETLSVLGRSPGCEPGMSCFVWMARGLSDGSTFPARVAITWEIRALRSLQRCGLLEEDLSHSQVMPTGDGVSMIRWLSGLS